MKFMQLSCVLLLASLMVLAGCNQPGVTITPPQIAPAKPAAVEPAPADESVALASPAPAHVERVIASGVPGLSVVQLDNGLLVIVKENHALPIVDVRFYVRTGGMYEGRWMGSGISHLCEHLTAEGAEHATDADAKAKPKTSRTDRIGKIGGQSNAATTQDYTYYYIEAASGKTMDCIDLVSEWMAKPSITIEDFEREHGIVQRELEMGKDQPRRAFYYALMANQYAGHPAGVPVIGYKPPLAALTYEDVLAYHAQSYVPQNMVYVVVGDVDTKAVLERLCKDVANFRPGLVPSHTLPDVEPVAGTRRVVVPNPQVKDVQECMAFQTVTLLNDDLYALDLLSTVLGEGQSSRLEQKVHREMNLVTSIGSGSSTPNWGKGYFQIYFQCSPEQVDQAEQAALAQMREVAEKSVTEQELARAKRQKMADLVHAQQTIEDQAETLAGDLMGTGDINFSRTYLKRIEAVTPQQVQAAAKKYFRFGDMVVTRMVPSAPSIYEVRAGDTLAKIAKEANTTAKAILEANRDQDLRGGAGLKVGMKLVIPPPSMLSGGSKATGAAAKATVFTLPNGLKVVLNPLPSTTGQQGLVSMVLATKGGLMVSDAKTNGMGNLMAALSTKGAGEYSAKDIAAFYDQAGGSIGGSCGNNSIYWESTVLGDSFDKALDIFANVVQKPTMDDKELDILRTGLLAGIVRQEAQPAYKLGRLFREKFFTGSPYRMQTVGTPEVIKAATPKALREYHDKHILAGASVLAIYGDFDPVKTRAAVEKLFADLPKGEVTLHPAAARVVAPGGELYTVATPDAENASVLVATTGFTIFDHEDQYPMDVLKTIISGWELPSGWLHDELRGKKLVYSVFAGTMMGVSPGAIIAQAECQPENANLVKDIIVKNLNKAATYTPTVDEINLAVNTILTAELLNKQSISGMATAGALNEMWGFGYNYRSELEKAYRNVKPQDVARVAKKYLGKNYVVFAATPQPEKITKEQK